MSLLLIVIPFEDIPSAFSKVIYNVPRPNSLWHIDGHHSLIGSRFIIHGGIDGYSRMVVYLQCNTNGKAESVLTFSGRQLICIVCMPSRV